MNEQIRLVAERAGLLNQRIGTGANIRSRTARQKEQELAKFANMIVAECAEIALVDGQATGNFEVFNKISRHFGVK